MPRFFVYGLMDPRDGAIRYVGKSAVGMKRPRRHLTNSSLAVDDYKSRWIRKAISACAKPEIVVLEICSDDDETKAAERKWIAFVPPDGDSRT